MFCCFVCFERNSAELNLKEFSKDALTLLSEHKLLQSRNGSSLNITNNIKVNVVYFIKISEDFTAESLYHNLMMFLHVVDIRQSLILPFIKIRNIS